MIRNNFLDIEDDICEDFDGRMYRAVKYDPWQDFSQYNGLTGYGRYWMTRLNFPTPAMQARECLTSIVKLIEEHLPDISAEEQIDVYCFYMICKKYPVLIVTLGFWNNVGGYGEYNHRI